MVGNLVSYGKRIVAGSILALIFFGPPVFALWSVIQGWGEEPLFAMTTKTYTTTEPTGLLVEATGLLIPWLLVVILVVGIGRGIFPRRI
jgi:hypothetical protein